MYDFEYENHVNELKKRERLFNVATRLAEAMVRRGDYSESSVSKQSVAIAKALIKEVNETE